MEYYYIEAFNRRRNTDPIFEKLTLSKISGNGDIGLMVSICK